MLAGRTSAISTLSNSLGGIPITRESSSQATNQPILMVHHCSDVVCMYLAKPQSPAVQIDKQAHEDMAACHPTFSHPPRAVRRKNAFTDLGTASIPLRRVRCSWPCVTDVRASRRSCQLRPLTEDNSIVALAYPGPHEPDDRWRPPGLDLVALQRLGGG